MEYNWSQRPATAQGYDQGLDRQNEHEQHQRGHEDDAGHDGPAAAKARADVSGGDGKEDEEDGKLAQELGALTARQPQVILGIEGEEGLNGVISHEPEEDGQEDTQGAFILVFDHRGKGFPHFTAVSAGVFLLSFGVLEARCAVFGGFFDKAKHQQRGHHHQHRSQPERVANIDIIQPAADERGDDRANPAHEVDDAVGLRALVRGGDVGHQRHHRGAPEGHAEQQGAGAGHE